MAGLPSPGCELCPSREVLAAFLREDLPEADLVAVGAHLSACPECGSAIQQLDAEGGKRFRELCTHFADVSPVPVAEDVNYQRMLAGAIGAFPSRAREEVAPPERIGHYQLSRPLGRGGMGVVYQAEHVRLKKRVAVKLLPAGCLADPRTVARFEREMEVIGRLDHPNIVKATDAGCADGFHYLVMELVDGVDLARLVRWRGPLPLGAACELVRQAAVALQHAHEHGLVHRDIKPKNLMLSLRGKVKLLDLGLALLCGQNAHSLTGSGQVLGTADYMAPEQWEASHGVDIRADIYSLGCTLYHLLVGQPPFPAPKYDTVLRKMEAHARHPLPPVRGERPDVPEGVAAVLDRMVAKHPTDRYSAPEEVARALAPHSSLGGVLERLSEAIDSGAAEANVLGSQSTADRVHAGLSDTESEATPAKRVVTSRHRRRRLLLLVTVPALLASGLALLSFHAPWRRADNPGAGVAKKESVEKPPREFRPGQWYDLLDDAPTEFHWWDPESRSHHWYDPKTKRAGVQAQRVALLGLGRSETPGFTLRLTFRQDTWTGGVGVFFGGQPAAEPGRLTFGWIELRADPERGRSQFILFRARGWVQKREAQMPLFYEYGKAAWRPPGPLGHQDYTLEVRVSRRGLESVSWDGALSRTLADGEVPLPHKDSYLGEFGLFCRDCSVTLDSAQYHPTE